MVKAIAPADITAIVLAGGRGSRMGGIDKGLQLLNGAPLALHIMRRVSLQVNRVLLNANRHLDVYQSFGGVVVPDTQVAFAEPFSGPLAGFAAGLSQCQTPYLLTVPCDSPRFPLDLASRLAHALHARQADIAMAAQGGRTQPVFCLLKKELLASLQTFIRSGGKKIDAWTALHHTVVVHFDGTHDDPRAFTNANTLEELVALNSPD